MCCEMTSTVVSNPSRQDRRGQQNHSSVELWNGSWGHLSGRKQQDEAQQLEGVRSSQKVMLEYRGVLL